MGLTAQILVAGHPLFLTIYGLAVTQINDVQVQLSLLHDIPLECRPRLEGNRPLLPISLRGSGLGNRSICISCAPISQGRKLDIHTGYNYHESLLLMLNPEFTVKKIYS